MSSMRWKPYLIPIKEMTPEEAKAFLDEHSEGDYILLDVRQPTEYEETRIPGGRLIPLPELYEHVHELDAGKPVIVYCRSGNRSRMAAQYLAGQGFESAYNLNGGILAWQGHRAAGSTSLGMSLLTGNEGPTETLLVAFGMEEGLREFYRHMSDEGVNPLATQLFDKLAIIEMRHKEMVFELYQEHEGKARSLDELESRILPSVMEGGITMEELLASNRDQLSTVPDILAMAMTIEAQGLDLYLRYAHRAERPSAREVLEQLAQEEKTHLSLLGNLMDKYK